MSIRLSAGEERPVATEIESMAASAATSDVGLLAADVHETPTLVPPPPDEAPPSEPPPTARWTPPPALIASSRFGDCAPDARRRGTAARGAWSRR